MIFLLLFIISVVQSKQTSPEALRTATDLLRSIGESVENVDPLSISFNEKRSQQSTLEKPLASPLHVPHYSLFASHNIDQDAVVDSSQELRFKTDAASLQQQGVASSSSATSTIDPILPPLPIIQTPLTTEGDVVGSYKVMFSASKARSIAASPSALNTLVQLSRRVILRLINPTNITTIAAHMIEIDIAFPIFLPKQMKKEFKVNATASVQRRELTINVALRGSSLEQDRAAMSELTGIDFSERVLTLYREEQNNNDAEQQGPVPKSINGTTFGIVPTNIGVSVGCPLLCGGNGACDSSGACQCYSGYIGADCSVKTCHFDCGSHGRCNVPNRTCECDNNWFGNSCENEYCPNSCSSRGMCNETSGVCNCVEHWTGEDCTTPLCPENCAGHGKCISASSDVGDDLGYGGVMPKCECEPSWSGEWCASPACPLGENDLQCSGNHLRCVNRTCHCRPGYEGEDCGQESCPNECSEHGNVRFFLICFIHIVSNIFHFSNQFSFILFYFFSWSSVIFCYFFFSPFFILVH